MDICGAQAYSMTEILMIKSDDEDDEVGVIYPSPFSTADT